VDEPLDDALVDLSGLALGEAPALEVGARRGQGGFGLGAVRDVVADAQHPPRAALVVERDAAAGVQQAHRAVGAHDALVEPERAAFAQGGPDDLRHTVAILGMHAHEIALVAGRVLRGRDAVDPVELVAPDQVAAADVPVPAAQLGDALGVGQPRLAGPQLRLGLATVGHVAKDGEIAVTETRALRHERPHPAGAPPPRRLVAARTDAPGLDEPHQPPEELRAAKAVDGLAQADADLMLARHAGGALGLGVDVVDL